MKYQKLFFVLAFAFAMGACKEESTVETNPVTTKNYHPMSVGSSATFQTVPLDSNGNEMPASSYSDSYTFLSTATFAGKSGYMVEHKGFGGVTDTTYFSNEGGASWRYIRPVSLPPSVSSYAFPKRWVKWGDFNSNVTTWTSYDTSVTNVPVSVPGLPGTLMAEAQVKQTMTKGNMVNITYGSDNKTVSALEITRTTNFKGKIPSIAQDFDFSVVSKLYYAENIGLVANKSANQSVNLGPMALKIQGYNETLINYTNK